MEMRNILKQSGAFATNYRTNRFFRARLKLTAYYTAGIFLIIAAYSVLVYAGFSRSISGGDGDGLSVENEYTTEESFSLKEDLFGETKDRLRTVLLLLDGLAVFMALGLSYYLAGKTLEPIEGAYIKQKKIMADSAHELRTPLAVIKTGIQAVGLGPPKLKEYIKLSAAILPELDRLINMVNDLLLLEKSDNLLPVNFDKINLSGLIASQAEFMGSYARNSGIGLAAEAQPGIMVNGSEIYLKRMLSNLIKNAVDYNNPGGTVEIRLAKDGSNARLTIKDTGIGIPAQDLDFIFERFYKAGGPGADRGTGAGLGLSIVKEIAERHGGTVSVESKAEKGTAVTVLFPLA